MRVNEKMKKLLSILLCLCMLLQNAPVMAFAATTDNLCDHHTEHTAECGYREGSAGSACTHEHSEDCYKIVACKHTHDDTCSSGCSHTCTVENGCITMELDCHHTHGDCGYAEAVAPQECTTCQSVLTHAENCGYVAPVAEVTCDCVPGEDGTLVHTEGCGYVAPVAEVKCACQPTVTHGGEGCTYVEGKAGSPCTHTHAVKVNSADSCYKLLCSHADGGHDDACGYVAAVEAHECHYECAECANSDVIANQSEDWCGNPLCSQEDAFHVTSCAQYVAPENPQCFCVEKCTEANVWCDVCGFDYSKCTGTDTAAAYADGDDLAISGAWMSSSTPYLASGSTTASATKPETGYAYWDAASNTLTLNNFTSATSAMTGIFYDGSAVTLRIELVGNNSVTGGTSTGAQSGVCLYNTNTNILFSGGGTLTATGIASGYGVGATGGNITVDSGTTLIATSGGSLNGVRAKGGSIIVNAGGSLTGNGGESGGNGVHADSITVNGGSLTGNSKVSSGVYADSITVSGDSHIVAIGGDGNRIPVGNLPEDYYYYASGDGTDKTFAHSTDSPLTGTVTETYFELVTAQHLSDTYTSNGDATHSRYCSCEIPTKVTAPEACSGGTATCTTQAECENCGESYGELAPNNHASTEFTYAANEDGTTHKKMHKCCNAVAAEAENHTGGTATCTTQAVCENCGTSYGELDANNHTPGENADYTDNGNGEHSYTCAACGTTVTEAHTYVDGTCACGLVKTYTITFNPYGDSGAKIVEINGEAKEILHGGTFTVPHGQELKVKFVNTVSQKETGVYCDAWDEDWPPIDFDYDEATNTMTIPANEVNRDIFIDAYAYVSVQFNLHGGMMTDECKESLEEGFGYTWNAETSTLKAGYGFNFALRPEYFQLAGHTLAGAKVDGSEEVVKQLKIRSDMTVDILWECDGTAILTPVPAKDATCMEAGNIAHYVCTCGKLYAEDQTTVLTEAEVKTDIDPTNHVGMDTATGKCACDYQFGFYVERDIEIDGIYHETYWFDNLSDALSYAHGSTDYGQYTTQNATVRLHRALTIEEGEIFSFQKQVVLDTNSFSVTNHGTLALEGYTYSTIPAAINGGTVTIGDKTYLWSSENNKWICAEGSHTEGTAATCVAQAICAICGESYGDFAAHTPDANGKCTVENCGYQYAAKVGDSFYETIHKALRAAEGISGCTLTLLDDVTLTSMSSYASYVNTGTFTLDLNGKTLSSNKRTLEVMGSADLTIRDGIGSGKIVSTGGSAVYLSGGKLTIESGIFEGSLDGVFLSYDSTLIVKGGTFTGSRAMITGSGSDCVIDLTAIDPTGFTLKNNGSGTFAPTLPSGYAMVSGSGEVVTSLSAEESATVKASLENATVTLDKDTFTYDGKEHKPTVTVVLGDKPLTLGVDYTVIYAQAVTVQDGKPVKWFGTGPSESECINAGSLYFAVVEGIGNYYTEDTVTLCENFVIAPRPLTVKADDQTILVGGQINEESVTVTEGSLVAGHTLTASIQLGQYTEAGSVVNQPGFHEDVLTILKLSCDIMDGEEYVTDNYSISFVSGNLTVVEHVHEWSYSADGATITAECKGTIGTCPIGKQTVTVKAEGKTYDGTPVTAELDGSIDGVTAPEITYTGNTNAGTHTASITIEGETASVKFTIEKATVTVTADAKSKPYGTDNPALTYTASGLVGGYDTLTGALETTATKTSNVGEYDIAVGSLAGSNYTINFVGAKLTITKAAAPEIQWPTAAALTYGQKLSDSTLTSQDENGTFAWQDGSIVPTVKNNGYVVVYTPKDTDNYDYTGVELTKTIPVTVSKAEPSIVWKSGYYNTYGTNMYITASVNGVDGEMIPGTAVATVYDANGNALNSVTCTKTDSTGTYFFNWLNQLSDGTYLTSGEYLVKLTYQGSDNYGEKTVELVTYTIHKRALTVTANDNAITYGDAPSANGVEYSGFVDGETEAVLGGELTYSYNYEQYGNVGTYTITPSGLTSGNYEITFKTGKLTVNAKGITVTADAVSKTYGDADPELTYTASGLVNGDKLSGALTREVGTDIGTYAITQGTLTAGSNYTINYTGATLTINKKPITEADVTLNGSLTYTGSEQTQPITVTEGITYELTGNKATNVGSYVLTVKGTGNHTGSITLDWTIAKAKLTITADNKVIYIGERLPTLTYTVSGLVVGDKLTKEPALTTNADADQAGSYTITVANADAGMNYAITYVGGTLTIMDKNTEVETKVETAALTEVPDGLKNTKFNTVEAIKQELTSRIVATFTGFVKENMAHYDVTLQFSLDGGENWIIATEENFPTEGITVTLPYPNGTNAAGYDFVVSHMFTVTSRRLGTTAGDVELPSVTEAASGIRVTLKGLSPVTLAWRATEFDVKIAGTTNGTVSTNVSKATSGTEVTVTVTPKYGYKMATLTVKDASGKSYAVSTDNSGKYYFTMPADDVTVTATFSKISSSTADTTNPKTGDDFNIGIWSAVMLMSSLSLVTILFEGKRRRYTK